MPDKIAIWRIAVCDAASYTVLIELNETPSATKVPCAKGLNYTRVKPVAGR